MAEKDTRGRVSLSLVVFCSASVALTSALAITFLVRGDWLPALCLALLAVAEIIMIVCTRIASQKRTSDNGVNPRRTSLLGIFCGAVGATILAGVMAVIWPTTWTQSSVFYTSAGVVAAILLMAVLWFSTDKNNHTA